MRPKSLHFTNSLQSWTALLFFGLVAVAWPLNAATLYWSGTGTWDTGTTANWGAAAGGPYNQVWQAGANAVFEGTAGTVSVSGTVTVNAMTINVAGYTFQGGALSLSSGSLTVNGGGTDTISATASVGLPGSAGGWTSPCVWTINGTLIVNGTIGGDALLVKDGPGTLTLNSANSYQNTQVNAGTLNLGNAAAIGASSLSLAGGAIDNTSGAAMTLANNGYIMFGSFTFIGTNDLSLGSLNHAYTPAALQGTTITVTVSHGNLTVNTRDFAYMHEGLGTNVFGLTKEGAGTLIFAASGGFTGPTTVNGGAVIVNKCTIGCPFIVNNGGTIGGDGTIGNASNATVLTVNSGGIVAPSAAGGAPCTLTCFGNVALNSGCNLNFKLGALGTNDLLVQTNGGLTSPLGGTVHVTNYNNGLQTGTYTLLSYWNSTPASTMTAAMPAGFNGAVNTGTTGQINLVVTPGTGGGGVDHFAISAISSPQTAGTPFTITTITAQDAGNNTVTSFNSTVTFGGTAGVTGTSGTFTSGVLSNASVTASVAGSNLTVTVSDGTGQTGSATIATVNPVNAAPPTKLAYTTVPSAGTAGTAFNVTVQAQDASGNPANVTSQTTITLSKASGSGSLSGTLTGNIASGANSVTISGVVYSVADTMTLTATPTAGMTGLNPVTSGNIVFSAVPVGSITWGAATTISGDTDVITTGTLVYAYSCGALGSATLNTVPFVNSNVNDGGSMPSWPGITLSPGIISWNGLGRQGSILSASYQAVLDGMIFTPGGSGSTLTLGGLTVGQTYKVQLWLDFSRGAGLGNPAQAETYGGGGSSVTLSSNTTDVSGGVGQYTIGTFTAGATTQTISLTGVSGNTGALNAIQLRTNAAPPAPPVKLNYITVPGTGTAGTAFNVTVQAQDANGNPANVTSQTTITLSKASGAGALSGTLTGNIANGASSVTISGALYSAADTMTLTASATSGMALTAVTSGNLVFSAASAAGISWSPATTISGDSDVLNAGTLVFAYSLGGTSATVNTVPFTAYGGGGSVPSPPEITLAGITADWNGMAILNGPIPPLSSSYCAILDGELFGNNPSTFTLTGLTIGQVYEVQLWIDNSRDTGSSTVTLSSSGGNSVTLSNNTTGVHGGTGQYTIGTFTAGSASQVISFAPGGAVIPDAIQLRTGAPVLDHFAISAITSSPTVGVPFTIATITAQDASNNTLTYFNSPVTFGGTAGVTVPAGEFISVGGGLTWNALGAGVTTSGAFTAGVLNNASVTASVAGSNLTVTVSDGAGHTGSATIATVNAFSGTAGQVKPVGLPALDTAHPLAQGLLFYGIDDGLGDLVNLCPGNPLQYGVNSPLGPICDLPPLASSSFGTALNWGAPDPAGHAEAGVVYMNGVLPPGVYNHDLYLPAGSNPISAADNLSNTATGGGYTFACAYVQTGVYYQGTPFGRFAMADEVEPWLNWLFQCPGTDYKMGCNILTTSGVQNLTWDPGVGNQFNVVVGVVQNTALGVGTLSYYANGNLIGTIPNVTATDCGPGNGENQIAFGGVYHVQTGENFNPWFGFVYFGGFWNRPLSASEVSQLTANPYGFLSFPGSAGTVDHFALSAISSPQTAGTPFIIGTITAQDAGNNKVTSFNATVTFGGTAGVTGTSGTFTAGVLSNASVTASVAGSNLTVTVDDGIGQTGSATIATVNTANSAPPTQLAYTTVPSAGTAGVAFNVTVQAQDASGNPQNVSSATTVTLSVASGAGTLSGTLTGIIASGANSVTISTPVYSAADTMTLTATPTAGMTGLNPVTSGGIVFSVNTPPSFSGVPVVAPSSPFVNTPFTITVGTSAPEPGVTLLMTFSWGAGEAPDTTVPVTGLTTVVTATYATAGNWTVTISLNDGIHPPVVAPPLLIMVVTPLWTKPAAKVSGTYTNAKARTRLTDVISFSGALPKLTPGFAFTGLPVDIFVGGAEITVPAPGLPGSLGLKGAYKFPPKNATFSGAVTFKPKLKTVQKVATYVPNTPVPFTIKVKGDFLAAWQAGLPFDPTVPTPKTPPTITVACEIDIGGNVYVYAAHLKLTVKVRKPKNGVALETGGFQQRT